MQSFDGRSTTANVAQTVLHNVTSIVTDVTGDSGQTFTTDDSDTVDAIVRASASITKAVAESSLFQDETTSSEDKMNVRQVIKYVIL